MALNLSAVPFAIHLCRLLEWLMIILQIVFAAGLGQVIKFDDLTAGGESDLGVKLGVKTTKLY
jgi:hypothetical protein